MKYSLHLVRLALRITPYLLLIESLIWFGSANAAFVCYARCFILKPHGGGIETAVIVVEGPTKMEAYHNLDDECIHRDGYTTKVNSGAPPDLDDCH